jgi:hypothetical protein
MKAAMIDLFCDSFAQVPERIVLDIDDTESLPSGLARGTATASCPSISELALGPAKPDPWEATTGKPVAIFLRPGKTPDGVEVACVLRHAIRQICARWPRAQILIRGDGHGACPRAGSWPDPWGRIEAITV